MVTTPTRRCTRRCENGVSWLELTRDSRAFGATGGGRRGESTAWALPAAYEFRSPRPPASFVVPRSVLPHTNAQERVDELAEVERQQASRRSWRSWKPSSLCTVVWHLTTLRQWPRRARLWRPGWLKAGTTCQCCAAHSGLTMCGCMARLCRCASHFHTATPTAMLPSCRCNVLGHARCLSRSGQPCVMQHAMRPEPSACCWRYLL
mmetsp:Transcript_6760/g.20816  ORF Transcript_6760/g.20816 Transcript_6760/m.20816 type:complete len:206 (+) Transcript_6760:201-818(+)